MARTSTYLNFAGTTEEAFGFYRTAFNTAFVGPIARIGEAPRAPETPALTAAEEKLVMHVELPVTGGHVLMGTHAVESMGHGMVNCAERAAA